MSVKQISVFTESKPGHLHRVLEQFESQGVNVRGYAVSDTGDYGIARFIVDDPEAGAKALENGSFAFTETSVLVLKLADTPGSLAHVMKVLSDRQINVLYSYSLISTYISIRVDDVDVAERLLEDSDVEVASQGQLKILPDSYK